MRIVLYGAYDICALATLQSKLTPKLFLHSFKIFVAYAVALVKQIEVFVSVLVGEIKAVILVGSETASESVFLQKRYLGTVELYLAVFVYKLVLLYSI